MRRTAIGNNQELDLNALERWLFHRQFRGKLRLANKYSDAIGLRRRPFRGIAHLPIGDYWLDTSHRLDWAMLFGGMEQPTIRWLVGQFPSIRGAWDVGGHHGEYSIQLARLLAPGFKVHVFEPFLESADVILRNVGANDLEREVFVHQQAVGLEVGAAELLLSAKGSQNHSLRPWVGTSSASINVPVTTLDTALDRYGVPEFVKIDIEGGELGAFQGGTTLLAEGATTFLLESELWDSDRLVLHRFLRDHGYTLRSLRRGKEVSGDSERMIVARPTHQSVHRASP
jgi:FkbM family methyltransferase